MPKNVGYPKRKKHVRKSSGNRPQVSRTKTVRRKKTKTRK